MSERGLTPRRINLAVLTHNALDYTKLCVESLCKNTSVPFNLFILDNVSTDDTPKWLAEQTMPNLNYVLSPVNTGVPGGRNKLIEMITPHLPDDGFIIFMDNDIELLPGWAEVYLDFFAEHPEVGIASAWGHQMQVWTTFRTLRPLPKLTGPVDVGCGGFVCWIKAETIKAVGPFDEQLGLFWHEDDDYSVRTLAAGYEVYALPHAPVIHHEHKSGVATDNSIKRDGSPANQAYLVDKWKRNGWVDGAGNIIRPDSSKSGPEWLEVSPSVMLRGASRSNGGYRLIEPCLEIEIKAGALSSPMELRLSLELLSDTLYSGMPLGAALWQGAQKLQEFKLGGGSPERHELRCVLPAYRDSMSLRLEADQYSIPVLNGHSTWDVNRWSFRLSSLSFSSAQAGIPITPVAPSASAVQPEKSRPALHWHAPLLDFSARSWTTRALTDAYGSRAGYSPLASDDIFMEELKKQPAELVRFSRTYGQSQSADTRLFDHPSLAPVKGALPWLASYPGTKRTIAWLDTQGDVLPSDTGRALAGLTEVWTDSSFHAGVLKGAGVPEGKVKIAPPAVDMRLLDPDRVQPIPEYTQGRFNFLCVTDASLEDGWDLLIQAYLSEFTSSDPVNLLIATAGNNITWIHRELLEFLKRSGVDSMRMPTISLVGMRFSQAFAPHMYRSARVLVMPARSGKLSHVLLEAMAMGLPVIATDWGANHDLLSESHAYPLKPAGLVPVPDFAAGRDGNAPGTARWAEPSPMELAQVMRQTYQLQSEAAARGARARAFVLGNYSIQKTADWVAERIGQLTVSDRQTDKVALAQAEVLVASGKQSTSVVVLESAPRVATPGMAEQEVSVSIDARTLLFPETYERGIGQYSLHHLEAVMRARPEWHYHLLFDKYEPGSPVDKLLMHPNVSHADFDDRDRPLARMHHITDPLGLLTGVDSPFRIAPNLPLSVVFFDLIPMVLKQYFSDQWPAHHKSAYITRLQQLVNSQAAILAISENTKQDLNRLLNVPLERVSTIMAGLNREVREERPSEASVRSTLGKFGLRQPFFMTVGGLDPHKGFGDTGKAFLIARQNEQVMLAVVGSEDDPYKGMYRKVFEQHGSAGVVFTGFVSREELECLYAAASGLIFPSRYEGFGLPVIEAMAAGCPVITTNAASLPEVAGDAAIMVNPGDAEGIAQAITRLIHSDGLRNDLIAKGYERARLFTWEKTAQVTVRVWERLMNLQGQSPRASLPENTQPVQFVR